MSPNCAVQGCRNRRNDGISLHQLPNDKLLRTEWLRRQPKISTKSKRPEICSRHFDKDAFHHNAQELLNSTVRFRATLKHGVLPLDESDNDYSKQRPDQVYQPEWIEDIVPGVVQAATSRSTNSVSEDLNLTMSLVQNVLYAGIFPQTSENDQLTVPFTVEEMADDRECSSDEMLPTTLRMASEGEEQHNYTDALSWFNELTDGSLQLGQSLSQGVPSDLDNLLPDDCWYSMFGGNI